MRRRGFTLIEMLVVIGILLILLALLLPSVSKARDQANSTTCASHVKVLTQGFLNFAADHDGHLPGSRYRCYDDPNPDHWCWLFGPYGTLDVTAASGAGPGYDGIEYRLTTAPQSGTLWKYIGDYSVYLCPSLTNGKNETGSQSNGRFDYAAFTIFDGAMVKDIPLTCQLHYPLNTSTSAFSNSYALYTTPLFPGSPADDGKLYNGIYMNGQLPPSPPHYPTPPSALNLSTHVDNVPTPIVCQEDPQFYLNSNLEAAHDNPDQIAHVHFGGSWIGSVDGSVTLVNEPDVDLYNFWNEGAHLWTINTQKLNAAIALDNDHGWGTWGHIYRN